MPTATNIVHIGPNEEPVLVSEAGHAYTSMSFDKIVPCVRRAIHNGSGGQQLENAPVGSIIVRNGSGNNPMFVAGIGNFAPFSGRGLTLYANETVTLPVKDMGQVSVMATVSGEYIECIGFLSGPDPTMDVSGIYIAPDETPPVISGVVPISGISGAAVESEISVLFSECMQPTSINTDTWTVRFSGSSVNVSGIVSADPLNCALYYFQPYSGTISGETMYVSRIAGGASGVYDVAGNFMITSGRWHWTTVSGFVPDTTLPTVSGTTPSSGTMDVSVNIAPIIQFSEQMQSGTINTSTVRLKLSGDNLGGTTVTLDPDLRTATLSLADPLDYNKAYEIAFTESDIMDLAGNAMSGDLARRFFTEDGPINQIYSATPNTNRGLDDDYFRIGHKIMAGTSPSFIGEEIVKVRFELSKANSPLSGIVSGLVVQLRKADNSVIHFTRPFTAFMNPAVELTTTQTAYDFYNSDNTYAAQSGDRLEVQWLSGTSLNEVRVWYYSSNVNNAVQHTYYRGAGGYSGATYTVISSYDTGGIIWAR